MQSAEIRERYLKFFEGKGHLRHASASLLPDDPTLLTTSAGMVQFKPYFLGQRKPPHTRLTTSQKCLRAKDLEEVGRTPRHHTFFEMLGNFSFGDYFKEEAITWAWEFLIEQLKLPAERLRISVYLDDDEAAGLWQNKIGISDDRFFRFGEHDNFWPAGAPSLGPNGPCGPCSEIFYDFGAERGCGSPDCNPSCDCNRHIEIWNLVFMQYERRDGGELVPLPAKNIDTGFGLERVASVLQGTLTNFETDLFMPAIRNLESLSGRRYEDTPVPFRVIADHIRGAAFLICDGVFPSNEGRGYLLRKILRRAALNGRDIGMERPFLSHALDTLVETLGGVYPELREKASFVRGIIHKEEEQFAEALIQGGDYHKDHTPPAKNTNEYSSGVSAFIAYDTYGLPFEEAEKIARAKGYAGVNREEFDAEMAKQRDRSRKGSKMDGDVFVDDGERVYRDALDVAGQGAGRFDGYDGFEKSARVVSLIVNGAPASAAAEGATAEIITDATPFYGEMGGQVGDCGIITTDSAEARIIETFVVDGTVMVHRSKVEKGEFHTGDTVTLRVDAERRLDIMRHHTATHLLHAALRETLGDHVVQSGSYVGPDKLRFDYTHHAGIDAETLTRIENLVNQKIMECVPVETDVTDFATAKQAGAMALFGEKYGAEVRMVSVGDFSRELCGGTHLHNTGAVGLFKITDEHSIGSSLRRIEAVAGRRALELVDGKLRLLRRAADALRVQDDQLPRVIENLAAEKDALAKELKKTREEKAREEAAGFRKDAETLCGASVFIKHLGDMDRNAMLSVYDDIKSGGGSFAVLIGAVDKGKPSFLVAMSEDLIAKGLDAGALIKQIAQVAGGGGGGKKHLAQAGGKDTDKINDALALGKKLLEEQLK